MGAGGELTIEQIYSRVPLIVCKGLCHEVCGAIPVYPAEPIFQISTFTDLVGPGRYGDRVMFSEETMSCPHLSAEKRCTHYEQRPLICRIWGVVVGMPCEFGCKPERALTDKEAHQLLRQASRLEAR
jgi:hypothetical protein